MSLTVKALGPLKAESTCRESGQSHLKLPIRKSDDSKATRVSASPVPVQSAQRPMNGQAQGRGCLGEGRPGEGGCRRGEPGAREGVQGTSDTARALHVAKEPSARSTPPRRNPAAFLKRETDCHPEQVLALRAHAGAGLLQAVEVGDNRCHRDPVAKGPCAP